MHTHARQKTNPIHDLHLTLATNNFYKALRHPVAAFHCRSLKNQHRQNAGRPSLVPQKFSSNPSHDSSKKPPIPHIFFSVPQENCW